MKKKFKKEVVKEKKGKIIDAVLVDEADRYSLTCQLIEAHEIADFEQAEKAGEVAKALVYEFGEAPNIQRGIRIAGVREAIRFNPIKKYNFIPKFRYDKEQGADGKTLQIVYCKNPKTGEEARGQASYTLGIKFDERKALTIAERNAMLKLLPVQAKIEFINFCVKKGWTKRYNVNPSLPENKAILARLEAPKPVAEGKPQPSTPERTKVMAQLHAILAEMNIEVKAAHDWFHAAYKVASLKDLADPTLKKIADGLKQIARNTPEYTKTPINGVMTPAELKAKIQAEGIKK